MQKSVVFSSHLSYKTFARLCDILQEMDKGSTDRMVFPSTLSLGCVNINRMKSKAFDLLRRQNPPTSFSAKQ